MKKILLLLFACCFAFGALAQQTHTITFNHAGKTVNGTFTTPAGSGKFPTIIINPGSGANDRNGTIQMAGGNAACLYPGLVNTTLTPYLDLANAMVTAGYAVLRYDKLEYTYTTPQSLGPITFQKLWLPVESAIDFVKLRPEVDTTQIILIGHSEGSSLIPYIAKRRTDVKALISIAGPRTPFDSLLAYQLVHFAQLCNGNVSLAQTQANQILAYYTSIRNNTWNASTPPLFGVPANVWADYTRITDSVAINYNQANLPTLFTGLQLDLNVPIAELFRFQNEVTIGADFYQVPGLNHYMTPNNVPQVSKVLTDTLIYWLGQRGITGIKKDKTQNLSLQIFPNPFSQNLNLAFEHQPIRRGSFRITDLLGKEIQAEDFTNGEGNFSKILTFQNLPAGVYLLQIKADGKTTTRKIIKSGGI